MSRLTASPFHKPSPYQFPQNAEVQPLLSPPETDGEYHTPFHTRKSEIPQSGPESDRGDSYPAPESATARFRRVSTMAYHNSGLRESRERTIQKSSKSLIVVIPPAAFSQEHGQLGNTLSLGPKHRLAHGILMPLFPTMYGQLTAIAREFNFPSTAGICLYLHYSDSGMAITPRITDISWQFIWGNVFDANSPSTTQNYPPISGRVEFDIDIHQARWYSSWISSSHREVIDAPTLHSRLPSQSFDGRTTFAEDHTDEENFEYIHPKAPRHVPRKLSLVDRFDTFSARSGTRPPSRKALSPPAVKNAHKLSPIFQDDEPKSAKQNLNNRVNSWRASASLAPTPLQTDGVNPEHPDVPGALPLDGSLAPDGDGINSDLNLGDFDWSISSAGPQFYETFSSSLSHVPSVHIAQRAEGSVCLTPSICTSFGPSDYDAYSPLPTVSPLPSPDLGQRMLDDSPPSPLTATSWGAPSWYSGSAVSQYWAPSVDIGRRQVFSPPMTPATATSWGAPLSYPESPVTPFYVQTPDAGQRSFDPEQLPSRPWVFVFPYFRASYLAIDQTDGIGLMLSPRSLPWNFIFPFFQALAQEESASSLPWGFVFPFFKALEQEDSVESEPWGFVFPFFKQSEDAGSQLWNFLFPFFKANIQERNVSAGHMSGYPHFNLCKLSL
jgi:hypothetical protein